MGRLETDSDSNVAGIVAIFKGGGRGEEDKPKEVFVTLRCH
jgi:hypothetical protein